MKAFGLFNSRNKCIEISKIKRTLYNIAWEIMYGKRVAKPPVYVPQDIQSFKEKGLVVKAIQFSRIIGQERK